MAIKASVIDFLKTGQIGPIRIGMTMAEVERLAGPPETDNGKWWLYGSVDIGFDGQRRCASRVYYLQVKFRYPSDLLHGFRGLTFHDDWRTIPLTGNVRGGLRSFLTFARKNSIGLAKVSHPPFDEDYGEFGFVTEGGVTAHFNSRKDSDEGELQDPDWCTFITEDIGRFYTARYMPVGFDRGRLRALRRERYRYSSRGR